MSDFQQTRLAPYDLIISLKNESVFVIADSMKVRFPHLKRGVIDDPGDYILHRETGNKLFISFLREHEDYAIEVALLWGNDIVKRRG